MISNEKYHNLLYRMVCCISEGDYPIIKELSYFELDKMKEEEKKSQKEIKRLRKSHRLRKNKEKALEEWEKDELLELIKKYENYLIEKLEKVSTLEELKLQMITLEEYVKKI